MERFQILFRQNFQARNPRRVRCAVTYSVRRFELTVVHSLWIPLKSFDRSMTVIEGQCSESFDVGTSDKALPNQVQYTNQNISRIHSQQNVDLRPVVTVDNSLLIKIMARIDHF